MWVQSKLCMARCRSCRRNRPSAGASQAAASGSKPGEPWTLQVRCCGVGGGEGSAGVAARGRREVTGAVDQPTARRANSSSRRLPPSPSPRVLTRGGRRRLRAAGRDGWQGQGTENASAAGICGGSVGSVQRSGSPPCGGDVATLLSLLVAAIRKGQQQCNLPPGIRNQDLESFLVTLGQLHFYFPGPQIPATPRAQAPHGPPSQPPFPVSQAQRGAGWMPGRRVLVLVVLFMALVAIIRPLNQLGPLQRQKEVNGCGHGLDAYSSCLNKQPQQQLCTQSVLDIPNAQFTPPSTNQRHPTPHFSVFHRQLLPCLSCGLSAEASYVPGGVAGDDDMDGLLGDEELERVIESTGEAEDSGHLESVKREAQGVLQLAAKAKRDGMQARPSRQ